MKNNIALIIEDDEQLSEIFSKSLEGLYNTEIIADGNRAVERLAQLTPALVILDLHLPGINGNTILENIRANPVHDQIHVILCTADERMADLIHEKADVVFLKPVNPGQLRQIASRFLGDT